MRWPLRRTHPRVAGAIALLACLTAASAASAASGRPEPAIRVHPGGGASASAIAAEAARTARYWTPQRMREAQPLDRALGRDGVLRPFAVPESPLAGASFKPVETPTDLPYAVNGRIFLRQGNARGYCSGTAINSPTRQLVLTAAHCVNSGPRPGGRKAIWSQFLEFVPAYTGGTAPFGAFIARGKKIFAPKQWIESTNPDYDFAAFLTFPNAEGVNVADAVGGGVSIVTDLSRKQNFQTFGYPGSATRMQSCRSPYVGDDALTYRFAGPPTLAIRCRWAAGASGGGWLIADGTQINGVNTYLHRNNVSRTYGPYFSSETVGRLVEGL